MCNKIKIILPLIIVLLYSCSEFKTEQSETTSLKDIPSRIRQEAAADSLDQLFIIHYNDHFGFINQDGKVVIDVKYKDASAFSEGLASVRLNGMYGYVNYSGEFVIKSSFDYALRFNNGLAKVFVDGNPAIINKAGEFFVEPGTFPEIQNFSDGVAIVKSHNELYGGINLKGELVIDTMYRDIRPFSCNRAVVTGVNHPDDIRVREQEIGVIDAKGKMIVKYGLHEEISSFKNGYARTEIMNDIYDDYYGWSDKDGIIDTNGNIVCKTKNRIEGYVSEGMVKISSNSYEGFMNLKGELVLGSLNNQYVEEFQDGYAVNYNYGNHEIIDHEGKLLISISFTDVKNNCLKNGMAIVQSKNNEKWGILDTAPQFIIEAVYENLHQAGLVNDRVFYGEKINDSHDYLWGILNEKGDTVSPAKFTEVPYNGFSDEIIMVKENNVYGYINKNGEYVWKSEVQEKHQGQLQTLNSSVMLRAYSFVLPSSEDTTEEEFTWGVFPKKATNKFPAGEIGIKVDTSNHVPFMGKYQGFRVYVYNTKQDTAKIEVQDGRLSMTVQAKNKRGEWKDIEYTPNSWCGNSYYDVDLLKNEYWELVVPKYGGDIKTEARIKLMLNDTYENGEKVSEEVIYSNPFTVAINPAQLWLKQGHTPNGIMDPYLE